MNILREFKKRKFLKANESYLKPKDDSYYASKWCNDPNNVFFQRDDIWNDIDRMCAEDTDNKNADEIVAYAFKTLGIKSSIFALPTTEIKKKEFIGNYPLDLLEDYEVIKNDIYAKEKMKQLNDTFVKFNIDAKAVNFKESPQLIRIDVKLGQTTVSKITQRKDDIKLALNVGTLDLSHSNGYLGIIIPKIKKSIVGLKNMLQSDVYLSNNGQLKVPLGLDLDNQFVVASIKKLKQLLIGGSTGGGKSSLIHLIICSLIYYYNASDLNLILVDFKKVSLPRYNSLPHLLKPCITEENEYIECLKWLDSEMNRRLDILEKNGLEDILDYNEKLPNIVVVIDELEDITNFKSAKENEIMLKELLRKSRCTGIHFILATQTPTKKVIPTDLRNNIPSRIAFKLDNSDLSEAILGSQGAEELNDKGDIYFKDEQGKLIRLQCAFIDSRKGEVNKIIDRLKVNKTYVEFNDKRITIDNIKIDDLFYEFGKFCIERGKASKQMFRDYFVNNSNRAGRVIKQLIKYEVISEFDESKQQHNILMTLDDLNKLWEGIKC